MAFHTNLVKPGLVSQEIGRFYDELFEARQRGDYIELVDFEKDQITKWLQQAREFINAVKPLTSEKSD